MTRSVTRSGIRTRTLIAALAIVTGGALTGAGCTSTRRPNATDAAFATAMVPHHEMGITLDELAVADAADVRVRRLAFEMNGYQGPELDQLRTWARMWGGASATRPRPMTGPMPQPMSGPTSDPMTAPTGMPAAGDLDRLRSATGPAFDTLFLTLMIAHHEGAVAMARREQSGGADRRAVAMAGRIAIVQQRQLAALKSLVTALASG